MVREVAAPSGQQQEPVVQPGVDLLRAQRAHLRGGQLERQRHTIQALRDARDGPGVVLAEGEQWIALRRPLHEEPDGGELRQLLDGVPAPGVRPRQRRDAIGGLSRHAQGVAAGGPGPPMAPPPPTRPPAVPPSTPPAAPWRASLVFPAPPAPMSVTSRLVPT